MTLHSIYSSRAQLIILLVSCSLALDSCGKAETKCINCTYDDTTRDICEDDLSQFTVDTGLEVSTIDEVIMIIELIGGSCEN